MGFRPVAVSNGRIGVGRAKRGALGNPRLWLPEPGRNKTYCEQDVTADIIQARTQRNGGLPVRSSARAFVLTPTRHALGLITLRARLCQLYSLRCDL
ncbi:MAG: hypothetical protein JWO95_794 [Verrucomicrobiales bacterium]|nr:hypothetical protein [Verrucomicrobiales bacterium]